VETQDGGWARDAGARSLPAWTELHSGRGLLVGRLTSAGPAPSGASSGYAPGRNSVGVTSRRVYPKWHRSVEPFISKDVNNLRPRSRAPFGSMVGSATWSQELRREAQTSPKLFTIRRVGYLTMTTIPRHEGVPSPMLIMEPACPQAGGGRLNQRGQIRKAGISSCPNGVWARTCLGNSVSQAGQQSCRDNGVPKRSLGTRARGKRREMDEA